MLNPGYKVISKKEKDQIPYGDPGPVFICPECKKPIAEAVAEKILTRCKHCRNWFYAEKVLASGAGCL